MSHVLGHFSLPRLHVFAVHVDRVKSLNVSKVLPPRAVPLAFKRLAQQERAESSTRVGSGLRLRQPVLVRVAVHGAEKQGFLLVPSAYVDPATAFSGSPRARQYRAAGQPSREAGGTEGGLLRPGRVTRRGAASPPGRLDAELALKLRLRPSRVQRAAAGSLGRSECPQGGVRARSGRVLFRF